jgi:hypothetical protein
MTHLRWIAGLNAGQGAQFREKGLIRKGNLP